MPVTFSYQVTDFRIKHRKQLTQWLLLVAYLEETPVDRIDFVFCDDQYLLNLNREFLSHNTLTDIITFDYSQDHALSAEIYISIERVRENAENFKITLDEELHRVMVHGMLHCLGYGDKSISEKKCMRRKENQYLKLFVD